MESYYEIYELIGEGSFGKVYRARCRQTDTQVAYKVISKNGRSLPEVHALRRECEIQKSLWHTNIIRMLHSFENEEELVVITEFAGKDLCHILKEEGVLGEIKARKIVCDLVSALYYLHSNRILHRDLKPQNVLIDHNGNAKLCDFGFAKVLCKDTQMLTSIKGTPLYMAPELMHEHPYDHNVDLWSLGCIAYELVTGHPPYSTSSILQLIKMVKLQPISWPNYLSEPCLSFLKGLLDKNPASRLTWPHLLYHQFISVNISSNLALIARAGYQNSSNYQGSLPMNSQPILSSLQFYNNFHNGLPITSSTKSRNNDNYVPSHFIEIKEQPTLEVNKSQFDNSSTQNGSSSPDLSLEAQKEEWLEYLRKIISSLLYEGDVEELIEKHSLILIMNTFNTYKKCPVIVTTVIRLLSLPFVVESISDSVLSKLRETYASCNVIRDLLVVFKNLVVSVEEKKLNCKQEVALQQLLLLVNNLVFSDHVLLQQFSKVYVSLNLFKNIKTCLSIRTQDDPLSVVKYLISIFLRLYYFVPQSRQLICEVFRHCIPELHALVRETKDMNLHSRVCTFINVLSCTQPNFLRRSPNFDSLIDDVKKLNMNSKVPSMQRITAGTLEVLRNVKD